MMLFGAIFEIISATYELVTVVTDVILNYEYIERHWVEEYQLSLVFLMFNGIVMGFLGLGRNNLSPHRCVFKRQWMNQVLGFSIGVLQMRVFVETLYAVIRRIIKTREVKKNGRNEHDTGQDDPVNGIQTCRYDGDSVSREVMTQWTKQCNSSVSYVTFIQVIVRDIPLFILQANATIHYRKWQFIDMFTVMSTFIMLLRGTAAYVAKEDRFGLKVVAFCFLVGQFVFRLGTILLLAMTKGLAILVYGLVITLCAIFSTAMLRLAHPSHRFVGQLQAVLFFPFYTLFVIDGSQLTAQCGSAVPALRSKKLVYLHLWRCLENVVGIVLAVVLPRYTDFGVSSDATVAVIGVICAVIYVVTGAVFHFCSGSCAKHHANSLDTTNNGDATAEKPYYQDTSSL
ncbi:unnamed protein product [Peronospora belbahrii]|uniref:Uncharacterized protein n=1 Tax=Peronospora belbahrii TaxID=622444 RepID=A0AAU9L8Y6_9STRA|nr:unnamed protein product [Peronospora belbahrii]